MAQTYEGMFLLDNEVVREDWRRAKKVVTDLVAKHGGTVRTARRWAERRLAYPIRRRSRATYLLAYYEIGADGIGGLIRDLDLSENVLRYLLVRADEIPPPELELSAKEDSGELVPPPPPEEEVPAAAAGPEEEAPKAKGSGDEPAAGGGGESEEETVSAGAAESRARASTGSTESESKE